MNSLICETCKTNNIIIKIGDCIHNMVKNNTSTKNSI